MATAEVQPAQSVPSYMRTVPGSVNVPVATFKPTAQPESTLDSAKVASDVVSTFNEALEKKDYAILSHLFTEDGYWRDHLAVTWTFRTVQTPPQILAFLQSSAGSKDGLRVKKIAVDASTAVRAPKVAPIDASGNVHGISFFITVDTVIGKGIGLIRLVEQAGEWKIFTLYTNLDEIRGHEEPVNQRRSKGVEHGGQPGRKNWAERRQAEADFNDGSEPAVLVIGKLIVL